MRNERGADSGEDWGMSIFKEKAEPFFDLVVYYVARTPGLTGDSVGYEGGKDREIVELIMNPPKMPICRKRLIAPNKYFLWRINNNCAIPVCVTQLCGNH